MAPEQNYSFTCTASHVAAQFNQHGNCATAEVDTVVLGKCLDECMTLWGDLQLVHV